MCAGFDKEKTTLDELLEYYMDHEPAVINIQMRNYVDKKDKSRHFKVGLWLVVGLQPPPSWWFWFSFFLATPATGNILKMSKQFIGWQEVNTGVKPVLRTHIWTRLHYIYITGSGIAYGTKKFVVVQLDTFDVPGTFIYFLSYTVNQI